MSPANISYVIGVVVLVGFALPVFGIQCFQCSSYERPECTDIQANDTKSPFLQECDQHGNYQMFCRKTVQKIMDAPNFTRITRSCGWLVHKKNESGCQTSDTDFKLETTCQCFNDACNEATATTPLLATFVCMLVALILCTDWMYS